MRHFEKKLAKCIAKKFGSKKVWWIRTVGCLAEKSLANYNPFAIDLMSYVINTNWYHTWNGPHSVEKSRPTAQRIICFVTNRVCATCRVAVDC